MRGLSVVVVLAGVCLPSLAEPPELTGKIEAVTVYRGQAMVTRTAPLDGAPGLREVVVTGLPEQIVPSTLFAEGGDGVEVRSVRYRARPVAQDVREEVRKLDAQMRALQDELAAGQRMTALAAERKSYLDKLEQFTAGTANIELTRGVLNAETLTKLSEFLGGERRKLAEEELKRNVEQRGFTEQLQQLDRERQALTGGSARTVREAVVFVNIQKPGALLRVRYLVNSANWLPSYTVRADAERQSVVVEYYAAIEQMSGEDWSDVAMTLSTATPSLTAKAPQLSAMQIALAAPQPPAQAQGASQSYQVLRAELAKKQVEVDNRRTANTAFPGSHPSDAATVGQVLVIDQNFGESAKLLDKSLNDVATEMQVLDLIAATKSGIVREPAPAAQEGLSVTYQVSARTSLPSRADRQYIQIASLPMKGEFYKVATPVLTSYVYDEASLANESRLVLLAGPVTTYVGGEFVGQSALPTVAAGERFTIGFGIDASLRASRELIDKKESTQGGNRIVEFTYRLAVENFGDQPKAIRVLDRIPVARGNELKVTLVNASDGNPGVTQSDAERKEGIVRAALSCKPASGGDAAAGVQYQFRLEYDKQMSIVGMTAN